jgi:cell volume regulation protein A
MRLQFFSILRSKSLSLKSNIRPTLELESGSNDPMAYVLSIAFLTLVVNQDKSLISIIPLFFQQMILGSILGLSFGKLSKFIINKIKLDFEGLYPVLVIALMFITFSATDFVGGNGFLAIYICAVYLGQQELIYKNTILKVYDGLAWLMQIVLFLTLGLLVFPTEIVPVMGVGLLISVFLIIIARPLSVFLSLAAFKMSIHRRIFISWVGLRGAVPIVFATYPLLAGIAKAEMIFNIVFFITVTSVIVQGTTISFFASKLKLVNIEEPKLPSVKSKFSISDISKTEMKEIVIDETCAVVNQRIIDLGFPKNAIIAMIKRNDKYLTPGGVTVIEPNDTLFILSDDKEGLENAEQCLKNSTIGTS